MLIFDSKSGVHAYMCSECIKICVITSCEMKQ